MYPRLNHVLSLLLMATGIPAWSQIITTVGGNSTWGAVYQNAVDTAGNLYAADYDVHVVYKVDRVGGTTVVAGTSGVGGYAGDFGQATSALLRNPTGVRRLRRYLVYR